MLTKEYRIPMPFSVEEVGYFTFNVFGDSIKNKSMMFEIDLEHDPLTGTEQNLGIRMFECVVVPSGPAIYDSQA
jgi:hypothetical protein